MACLDLLRQKKLPQPFLTNISNPEFFLNFVISCYTFDNLEDTGSKPKQHMARAFNLLLINDCLLIVTAQDHDFCYIHVKNN